MQMETRTTSQDSAEFRSPCGGWIATTTLAAMACWMASGAEAGTTSDLTTIDVDNALALSGRISGDALTDIDLLVEYMWSDLILDEAQNIKTPTAKQTQAIRRLRGRNRIALTGTPVENRLTELWSIMRFLNPDYIGSRESHRLRCMVVWRRFEPTPLFSF